MMGTASVIFGRQNQTRYSVEGITASQILRVQPSRIVAESTARLL